MYPYTHRSLSSPTGTNSFTSAWCCMPRSTDAWQRMSGLSNAGSKVSATACPASV